MENFEIFMNGIACHEYMHEKIKLATNVIYISAWQVDLTYILDKELNLPLYKTLLNKCKQNVKVYVLTSIAPGTNNLKNNIKIINKIKHKNFNFKMLDMYDSYFPGFFKMISYINSNFFTFKKCCKRLFHQRYFNVDNKYCMIGGVDMDDDLYCSLDKSRYNKNNFYWVEYGVVFKPQKEFIDYCYNNFISDSKSSIKSKYFFGNFYNVNTEYNFLRSLIKSSKKSILIENQWIFSNNFTKNTIMKDICDQIIKKNIKVLIFTNNKFIDVCHSNIIKNFNGKIGCKLYTYAFNSALFISLNFMYEYLRKHGLSNKQINDKLCIYTLKNDILVHIKNIIIDHDKMLYGTSNIWDRSYTKGNDLELSIFLKGPKVKLVEKRIIEQYKNGRIKLNNSNIINKVINSNNKGKKIINKFYLIIDVIIISLIIFIINKYYRIKINKSIKKYIKYLN